MLSTALAAPFYPFGWPFMPDEPEPPAGPEGRRKDPRIGKDRQALIMSGAAILQALLRIWPTDRLSVADRGLREGLLYAQMSSDGVLDGDGSVDGG